MAVTPLNRWPASHRPSRSCRTWPHDEDFQETRRRRALSTEFDESVWQQVDAAEAAGPRVLGSVSLLKAPTVVPAPARFWRSPFFKKRQKSWILRVQEKRPWGPGHQGGRRPSSNTTVNTPADKVPLERSHRVFRRF